ncbi:nucleoside triphosphatase NudI, partial [Escherichia coli]|nr:nucleoside triphosphatase NudI [Escherichia coli]
RGSFRQSCNSILRCPSVSDGRLSYQFSSDGYIRRSVYAYYQNQAITQIYVQALKPWAFRDDIRTKTYPDGTHEDIYMIYLIFDCISTNRTVTFNEECQDIVWESPDTLKYMDLNEATRIWSEKI